MTRVRGSGPHEISESRGNGSRAKLIDSNAMARVEVVSLINTRGRASIFMLARQTNPSKQLAVHVMFKTLLSRRGAFCKRFLDQEFFAATSKLRRFQG